MRKPFNINRFDGGISEDKRLQSDRHFSISKHFDTFTYPHKLIPQYATEANETKAYDIVKFLYAPWRLAVGGYRLYGYGVVEGTTKPAVYMYDVDSGIPHASNWQVPASNEGTVTNRNENVFFYYKLFIYMWAGGTSLSRFETEGAGFTDAYQSINYTSVIQPVHHPVDDIAYFFTNFDGHAAMSNPSVNRVHKLDNTSWTTGALTLPPDYEITAACAHGNYLAIACATKGTGDIRSVVFLWDRDSSSTTLTERIDFGEGKIVHLASLENRLVAVMNYYIDSAFALRRGKVISKIANGNFALVAMELTADNTVTSGLMSKTSYLRSNKLYFPMSVTLNSDSRLGIWAVDHDGKMSLEVVESEATSYQGIFMTGNFWWIAHSNDGSVNRTDDGRSYGTDISIYESLILNFEDSGQTKKLVVVGVSHDPLPADGTITLKYRKDEETSWTTIYTHGTDNSVFHESINIESSGATLPEFREIQFQVISNGGAIITGIRGKYDEIPKGLAN